MNALMMDGVPWSPSQCQVWVRSTIWRWLGKWRWHQCDKQPVLAKESVLLCARHRDMVVKEARVIYSAGDKYV